MKYILYCRKSTDTEDRQVLSLDSQERELLDIAKRHNLSVVKVLRESMSAKSAGRPIFDQMMKMIDSGKADAILCWKLDRLARNFVDGGKVMQWVIDTADSIKTSDFQATPGNHCKYCDFNQICPFASK
jgi:DNA invertase Pin-like site-specific DNA recombinase